MRTILAAVDRCLGSSRKEARSVTVTCRVAVSSRVAGVAGRVAVSVVRGRCDAVALMRVLGGGACSVAVVAATLAGGGALVDVLASVGEARVSVARVGAGVGVGDGARAVMVVSLCGEGGWRVDADDATAQCLL